MSDETKESAETSAVKTETASPPAEQTAPGGSKFDAAAHETSETTDGGEASHRANARENTTPTSSKFDVATTQDSELNNSSESVTPTEPQSADGSQTSDAYEKAKEGGRHSGWLQEMEGRSDAELERGIQSLDRQIAEHRDKIAHPEQHIPDFQQLDSRQQEALLNKKWPADIARQEEQRAILQGVLRERRR